MNRLKFSTWASVVSVGLLIFAICFMVDESIWLDNTIGGLQLSLWAIGIGGIAGFVGSLIFGLHWRHLLDGMSGPVVRTLQFSLVNALILALLCLGGASFANRKMLDSDVERERVTVEKKSRSARGKHYIFFSQPDDRSERIEVDAGFFSRVQAGSEMVLTKQKGALGFFVISRWEAT